MKVLICTYCRSFSPFFPPCLSAAQQLSRLRPSCSAANQPLPARRHPRTGSFQERHIAAQRRRLVRNISSYNVRSLQFDSSGGRVDLRNPSPVHSWHGISARPWPPPYSQRLRFSRPQSIAQTAAPASTKAAAPAHKHAAADPTPSASPVKTIGNKNAPITMEVFSDYQCPSCGSFFENTLRAMIQDYVANGKVYLVHHDFPLQMHTLFRGRPRAGPMPPRMIGQFQDVDAALFDNQAQMARGRRHRKICRRGGESHEFQTRAGNSEGLHRAPADFEGRPLGAAGRRPAARWTHTSCKTSCWATRFRCRPLPHLLFTTRGRVTRRPLELSPGRF